MAEIETCPACGTRVLRTKTGGCPACGDGIEAKASPDPIVSETPLFLTVQSPPELPHYCACCRATEDLRRVELPTSEEPRLRGWSCEECEAHLRGGPDLRTARAVLWILLFASGGYGLLAEVPWALVTGLLTLIPLIWLDARRRKLPKPAPVSERHAGPVSLRWLGGLGTVSSCHASLIEDIRAGMGGSPEGEQFLLRLLHAGVETLINPYVPQRVRALLQSFRAGAITLRLDDQEVRWADLDEEVRARFTMEHVEAMMERCKAG